MHRERDGISMVLLYERDATSLLPARTLATVDRTAGGFSDIAAVDMEPDGDLDLLWRAGIYFFLVRSDPSGTFSRVDVPGLWDLVSGVAFGDYDRDGDLDFAFGRNSSLTGRTGLWIADGLRNHLIAEYQFNELRGRSIANTATHSELPAAAGVDRWAWQGDPGRENFGTIEAGFGCLGAGTGAVVDTLARFPLRYDSSFTVMWWQRLAQPIPAGTKTYFWYGRDARAYTYGGAGGGITLLQYLSSASSLEYTSTTSVQGNTGTWQHIAIVVDHEQNLAQWVLDGVADPSTSPGGANLMFEFILGSLNDGVPPTAYFDIDDFRIYRGALSLERIRHEMASERSVVRTVGGGCQGTVREPELRYSMDFQPGHNMTFVVDSSELYAPVVVLFGASSRQWLGVPLPLDLGGGCQLHVAIHAAGAGQTGGGRLIDLPLPADPVLLHSHLYVQAAVLEALGLAMTNAVDVNLKVD